MNRPLLFAVACVGLAVALLRTPPAAAQMIPLDNPPDHLLTGLQGDDVVVIIESKSDVSEFAGRLVATTGTGLVLESPSPSGWGSDWLREDRSGGGKHTIWVPLAKVQAVVAHQPADDE